MGEHHALGIACGPRGKKNVGEVLVDNLDCGWLSGVASQRIGKDKDRYRKCRIGGLINEEDAYHRTFIMQSGAEFLVKRRTCNERAKVALPGYFHDA